MAIGINTLNPVYIYGDPPSDRPTFDAVNNVGLVVWGAEAGAFTLSGDNDTHAVLTPPNVTRTIRAQATDQTPTTATSTVQVFGRFPLHAYFPHNADVGQKVEYSESEDKDPESELASVRGSEYIVFNYVAKDRPLSEYKLLREFLRAHRGQYFYYLDLAAEETLFCRADSDLRRETAQFERFDLTVVLVGKIIKTTAEETIGA